MSSNPSLSLSVLYMETSQEIWRKIFVLSQEMYNSETDGEEKVKRKLDNLHSRGKLPLTKVCVCVCISSYGLFL